MTPQPPAWFVHALKSINPHFGVEWDRARNMWAITEAVRHVRREATLNGAAVFVMHRRPEAALRFKGLGSKILTYVRRNDPRKYRSVKEMVDKLGIDKWTPQTN